MTTVEETALTLPENSWLAQGKIPLNRKTKLLKLFDLSPTHLIMPLSASLKLQVTFRTTLTESQLNAL